MSSIEELSNKVNLNQDVNIEKEVNNGVNKKNVNIARLINLLIIS